MLIRTYTLNFDFLEKGLGIVSPPYFVYDFSRKMFLMLYSINWPNFIVWLPLLLEILGNISNQAVFIHTQKFKTKTEISWEWNELLRWNKKHFSSFLKGFQLSKIVSQNWGCAFLRVQEAVEIVFPVFKVTIDNFNLAKSSKYTCKSV